MLDKVVLWAWLTSLSLDWALDISYIKYIMHFASRSLHHAWHVSIQSQTQLCNWSRSVTCGMVFIQRALEKAVLPVVQPPLAASAHSPHATELVSRIIRYPGRDCDVAEFLNCVRLTLVPAVHGDLRPGLSLLLTGNVVVQRMHKESCNILSSFASLFEKWSTLWMPDAPDAVGQRGSSGQADQLPASCSCTMELRCIVALEAYVNVKFLASLSTPRELCRGYTHATTPIEIMPSVAVAAG